MATGTPKKHKSKAPDRAYDSTIALTYSGKAPLDEVLMSQPGTYAECWKSTETSENRLFYAENLAVLAHLLKDPTLRGNVRLIYIDPPFATQTVFHSRRLTHAYEDTLAGPEFLEFIRKRLILLRELLSDDGSIYLHIDEKMVFPLKVILDEIFGSRSFRNCIARRKCTSKNYTRKAYGKISDYILFYTKTDEYVWNKPLEPWTELRAKEYQYIDENSGRRFMKVPVHAPGIRNGETGKPWRGVSPPPGKHWQFPPAILDQMDARGEIYWSSNGNPRRKIFLDQNPGIGVADLWLDFRDAHNQNIQITGYPTEKNPAILERIVMASSNPGDIVLDCFSGSGTTLAVADRLGRRWIGVDNSEEAIRTTLRRFKHGTEKMGDFVSIRKKGKSDVAGRHEQAALLLSDDLDNPKPNIQKHLQLPSFILLSDKALATETANMIKEWQPPLRT
jgi:adenine-specific DNA-methyltransferase